MVPQSIPPSDKGRKLPWNSWDPQRPGTPSDWSDPPAHGPSGGTKHPVGGGIIPPTGLPAEQNTQWVEESSRRQSFRRPETSNGRRKHPCAGIRKGVPGASRPGIPRKPETKRQKKGVPGAEARREPPTLNAAACYSPTPSRVQYHRRDQALASGFGKGPGVSPGP